jgi:hypothetical protein
MTRWQSATGPDRHEQPRAGVAGRGRICAAPRLSKLEMALPKPAQRRAERVLCRWMRGKRHEQMAFRIVLSSESQRSWH